MAYRSKPNQSHFSKQELYNLVDRSSTWPMEDKDNVADYFKDFWTLGDPLVFHRLMSKRECNELFWQGFHCHGQVTVSFSQSCSGVSERGDS